MPFYLIVRRAQPVLRGPHAVVLADRRDELLFTARSFREAAKHAEELEGGAESRWRESHAFCYGWRDYRILNHDLGKVGGGAGKGRPAWKAQPGSGIGDAAPGDLSNGRGSAAWVNGRPSTAMSGGRLPMVNREVERRLTDQGWSA